ncbi:phosphate transport system substrate-binding protein [Methanolinea mesophila]|uniref:phosphate ABC transporter substrate-binding protein n=1 Tax=Methanolinea mesophila TaxID=547055 RepID=UPI001AE9BD05|nr:phosphate ABC transporter substrate-binding protein [Methanolinea mesophila]MBP1928218.1 phosphate transport system substrate-binding protein [Methanolinea mesophila]
MAVQPKKTGYIVLGLAALLVLALCLCGCTQAPASAEKTPTPAAAGGIQSLSVTGSTTVLPIAQSAAEDYMDAHSNVDIKVSGGGSGVGVQAIGEGTTDIGMSSRELTTEETTKYPNLVVTTVAGDGIAVIVNPANTVNSLTLDQIKAIYQANITNWKEVGGPDETIVLIGRDSASGTRSFFTEMVLKKENAAPTMLEQNSNGGVLLSVGQTPGAIGYISIGYLTDSVKALDLDANGNKIEPTVANVKSGQYPISRPLLMITQGAPQGLAKDYLDYIQSPEGQAIVAEEGYVSLT